MLKNISFKFKIYPTIIQKEKIDNNIQCARFVYNKLLDSRIYNYGKFLQYTKRYKKWESFKGSMDGNVRTMQSTKNRKGFILYKRLFYS